MEKLIIENRTGKTMEELMGIIAAVVSNGKISKTKKGEQYCFVSKFKGNITVYAVKNNKSDRLVMTEKGVD